jgi:ABC-2 type transport system ATP-binding protein
MPQGAVGSLAPSLQCDAQPPAIRKGPAAGGGLQRRRRAFAGPAREVRMPAQPAPRRPQPSRSAAPAGITATASACSTSTWRSRRGPSGIVGPSGAGKTTTIRLITGALVHAGEVRVLGEDPRRFHRGTRERIGYMPQQFTLYPPAADENVDFVASLYRMLFRRRQRGPRGCGSWPVDGAAVAPGSCRAGCSGGSSSRAPSSTSRPCCCSTSGGIDPILRKAVWAELNRLKEAGRTLLVTTQYVTEAEVRLVALIAGGRLIALGAPDSGAGPAAATSSRSRRRSLRPSAARQPSDVQQVRSTGARTAVLVVDDAGTFTPQLDDLVTGPAAARSRPRGPPRSTRCSPRSSSAFVGPRSGKARRRRRRRPSDEMAGAA